MADFAYLDDQRVTHESTSELTLYDISVQGVSPTLIGRPATEQNRTYFNAQLKASAKNQRRIAKGQIDAGMVAANRDRDRDLYPAHVLTGWRDVRDGSGAEVPFTPEVCRQFLARLPDHVFDVVRDHFSDPNSFVTDTITREEADDTGNG